MPPYMPLFKPAAGAYHHRYAAPRTLSGQYIRGKAPTCVDMDHVRDKRRQLVAEKTAQAPRQGCGGAYVHIDTGHGRSAPAKGKDTHVGTPRHGLEQGRHVTLRRRAADGLKARDEMQDPHAAHDLWLMKSYLSERR